MIGIDEAPIIMSLLMVFRQVFFWSLLTKKANLK